jgi:hypothetical protein
MLKFTSQHDHDVYINVMHIVGIEPDKRGSGDVVGTIIDTLKKEYRVKESVADVMKLIDDMGF